MSYVPFQNTSPLANLCFTTEKGKTIEIFTALSSIRLGSRKEFKEDSHLIINDVDYKISEHEEAFFTEEESFYVNLMTLLNNNRLPSTSFHIQVLNRKKKEIDFIYVNHYQMLADPREHDGHLELQLGDVLFSAPYRQQGKKSNLAFNLNGEKLYLLVR
jgi:hypothetical protein